MIAVFTFSCETAAPECDDNPAAGYLATADGKTDARDADPANLDIIDKYLDAHNAACLLYTSPSPRDRTRSRMPSSA